ncbi:MAG: EamA family transporter [Oculatellaceae cyanobacterium Prado106]|jgi:inner membrane transporter RhtA|nr:EamA family transporter [Oculatellaceae cyanobacterium Prado106]
MPNFKPQLAFPATGLVLLSNVSVQGGAAIAKSLFPLVGSTGMVWVRVAFATIILCVLQRPSWSPAMRQHWKIVALFGIVLISTSLLFYAAIDRIPMGIASTLELTGPLGLAALKSKQMKERLWVLLAFLGLLLFAPTGEFTLDGLGILFALLAACCWAWSIQLSVQVGQLTTQLEGLCWAIAFGAVALAPFGIASAGVNLLEGRLLLLGLGVAMLSSTLPCSLEIIALRTLPVQNFGVLKSLEPVFAALSGFLILGETLTLRAICAILLVSFAAAGSAQMRD